MSRPVTIYGLLDEHGAVRYIGQTVQSAEKRLAQHLEDGVGHAKSAWLHDLEDRGHSPRLVVLEVVPEEMAYEAEQRHITEHAARGCALTNGMRQLTRRIKRQPGSLQPLTVMLPEEVVARVQQLAEQTATPPSVLLRQWIMEREQAEKERRRP